MYGKSWIQKSMLAILVFILVITSPAFANAARDEATQPITLVNEGLSVNRVEPQLSEAFQTDEYVTYFVKLKEQANVNSISKQAVQWSLQKGESSAKQKKTVRNFVVNSLVNTAEQTQTGMIQQLEQMQASGDVRHFHPYYIVNAIAVTSTKEGMEKLAHRPEVEKLVPNHTYTLQFEPESKESLTRAAQSGSNKEVPWNLRNINVEQAWNLGIDGTGIVVANIDSGVDGTHPALQHKWRALDSQGNIVNPELSWFDATLEMKKFPTDSNGHGTHVMGTMVGSDQDGSNKIGVAPNAKWIAARVFDSNGQTTDADIIKAGEWILAPTDKQGNKYPELAPDVVNNSWGNVASGKNEFFQDIVKAWIASDIFPAFSAGNAQPPENNGGLGSITAPGNYPESFATGAVDINSRLADFSLQGPTPYGQIKPEVSAPGVHIRSAIPGGQYALMNGTSMASPHTAGVAALIKQANPSLKVTEIGEILKNSADSMTDDEFPQSPNNGYGWGVINALSAVSSQKPGVGLGTVVGQVTIDGVDSDSPTIEHEPVALMFNTLDKDIFARVKDDISVASVVMYVREKGANEWKSIPMKRTSGNHLNGVYEGSIPVSELSLQGIEYFIQAVDFAGNETKTAEYPVKVSKGVTIGYMQDFETSIEGFGFSDTSGIWEWGVPTSGPNKAFSGTKVMATVLGGKYPEGTNSYFEMPVIDLTDKKHAVLSFTHWYRLGSWWSALYDRAEVFIGTKKSNFKFERVKNFQMKNTNWTTEYIDLSPYAGDQIYVVFNLRGDYGNEDGWYIDDIKVQSPEDTPPVPPTINVRTNSPGKVIIDFSAAPSGKLKEYVIYRKKDKNGTWVEIGTSTGYNFADLPKPQKGTYYYAVKARTVSLVMSNYSNEVSWTFTGGTELFNDDFEGPDKGWTVEGVGSEWQLGTPDPTKGPKINTSGKNVWGTQLSGPYAGNRKHDLVSPEIDLTQAQHASLYFQQYYDIEDDDQAIVEVSQDQGKTWKSLAVYPKQNYNSNHPRKFWYLEELSLEEFVGQKVKVRFRLDSKSNLTKLGWYIDDVEVRDTLPVMTRMSSLSSIEANHDTKTSQAAKVEQEADQLLTIEELREAKRNNYAQLLSEPQAAIPGSSMTNQPIMADVTVLQTDRVTRTDAGTGQFTLKHPPGDYTLQVEAYGYKSQQLDIQVEENKQTEVHVHLQPLTKGRITGRVTDINTGKPIVKATVRLMNDARVEPAVTNSEGAFEIEAYEGEYQLSISGLNYLAVEDTVTVAGNDTLTRSYELHGFQGISDELAYDDGVADNAKAFINSGNGYAVRMTTNGPAQVNGARFLFWNQGWPTPGGEKFKYAIYDASGPDGLPGKLVAGPYEGKAKLNGDWTDVVIHNPVVFNGDFYLAYIQEGDLPHVPGLSMTKAGDYSGRSWKQDRGTWKKAGRSDGNYMIRAKVTNIKDEPVIVEPTSGSKVQDRHMTVTGTYPTEGTTIQLYHQDILVESGTVQQGRFAIPVILEPGENQLYVVAESNGQVSSKSATVIVVYQPEAQDGDVQSISVQPNEVTMKEGEQASLSVTAAVYENGDVIQLPLTDGLVFTMSDHQVAEVDQTGRVTAVHEGTSVVQVTYQQWTAEAKIMVQASDEPVEEELQSITVYPDKLALYVGDTFPLSVTAAVKVNGEVKIVPVTDQVAFISSDDRIARVDKNGRVTGQREGTVDISVLYKDKKAVSKISVLTKNTHPYEPPTSSSSGSGSTTTAAKDKRVPIVVDGNTIGHLVEQATSATTKKSATVAMLQDWMNARVSESADKPIVLDLKKISFYDYERVSIEINAVMTKQLQTSGKVLHILTDQYKLEIPAASLADYVTDKGFQLIVSVQDASEVNEKVAADKGQFVSDLVTFSNHNGELTHPITIGLAFNSAKVKDARKVTMYFMNRENAWGFAGISSHSDKQFSQDITQVGTYVLKEFAPTFADIANHWGQDAIEVLAAQHVLNGTGGGKFTPNSPVTRAQFITMLDRLVGDRTLNMNRFGMPGGSEPLTRAEMVDLLVQRVGEGSPSSANLNFTDMDKLSANEKSAIAYAVEKGWIQGIGTNRFGGKMTSTRAQVATILYRYMKSANKL